MSDWKQVLIPPTATLRQAIERIDQAKTQVALVVDEQGRLLGTLADGDIRRGLLAGRQLEDQVEECMCRQPSTLGSEEPDEAALARMRRLGLHQLPVIDTQGRVIGLKMLRDFIQAGMRDNSVVIMAGGLGTRLRELTRETPKPMLKVGDRPLLETIIRGFIEQGFSRIWIAVNYQAERIESHFGDGSRFGAEIRYLREDKRLGTAGALSLLPEPPLQPLLVTNADLLTLVDYSDLIDAHIASGAWATMAVREYEYQIPFGVVQAQEDRITALEEKPIHRALVNAGIYALSPQTLEHVPRDSFFDMPELFSALLEAGHPTRCHPVHGYWLDIGRHEDLHRANRDYPGVFR